MSLIPCRFFGTANGCRFGDNCKFYHARGGNNQVVPGAFGGRPQAFNTGGLGQTQQDVLNLAAKSQQNMDAMIEMVKKDMLEWENGHIFPFSCYGPSAGKPCVPGFEDLSAEELRYRFYVLNNKTPVDLTREVSLIQQARMQYVQISPTIRNILERVIVKGEKIDSTGMASQPLSQTQNAFQVSRTASVFGGGNTAAQPAPNIFGQASTGLFGGTTTNQGIFGSTIGQQQSTSVFGSSVTNTGQQSSIFGGPGVLQPSASSIFGSPPAAVTNQTQAPFGNASSPSIFGGAITQGQQGQSVFGGGTNLTGVQQQQNMFAGGTTDGGLFGTSNTTPTSGGTPVFGNISAATPVFGGTMNNNNMFPQTQSPISTGTGGLFSSNIFGNSTASPLAQPQTSSIFGQPSQQPSSQFSNSPTLQGLLTAPAGQLPSQPNHTVQQQPSLFGAPPTSVVQTQPGLPLSGSFFGSPSQTSPASVLSPLSFGGSASLQPTQPQTSLFGTPQSGLGSVVPAAQKYVYTEESELTPEELEAFRAPAFTLENIPTRPPPKSLCGM